MRQPGAIAPRGANFTLQNADLMIVIGSRLDMAFTGYAHEKLARGAKKVMVDIDEAEIKKMKTPIHLPIIADPSHGTGHAHLVPAMSRAALAAGADGLILEVHLDPEHALSDGAQSITPDALADLMPTLKRIAEAIGRTM